MAMYRFYCMGRQSRVEAVRVAEFVDDDEARRTGETLLDETGSNALEVWTRWRLVARLESVAIPA